MGGSVDLTERQQALVDAIKARQPARWLALCGGDDTYPDGALPDIDFLLSLLTPR